MDGGHPYAVQIVLADGGICGGLQADGFGRAVAQRQCGRRSARYRQHVGESFRTRRRHDRSSSRMRPPLTAAACS
jgi:hypothetical protein